MKRCGRGILEIEPGVIWIAPGAGRGRLWHWFRCWWGPDYYRQRGWSLCAQFIARADLAEDGMLIPTGLSFELRTRPLRLSLRSDVDEITTKLAALPPQDQP